MMRIKPFIPFSVITAAAIILFGVSASMATVRFFNDDPLEREPESQDASKAQSSGIGDL